MDSLNAQELHDIISLYNWDDGFEIPIMIMRHPQCTLGIAMMMFYDGDGYSYLLSRHMQISSDWLSFIQSLYMRIIRREYPVGNIPYTISLTNTQRYKISKQLTHIEHIFLEDIL